MKYYRNNLYQEDLKYVCGLNLPWEKLYRKSILLSGATGLMGRFLVDVLMSKNQEGLDCHIYALSRNKQEAEERFSSWEGNDRLTIILCDINNTLIINGVGKIDYVLHMASNTHPMQYAKDPIGTITTNIIGVHNMLDFAEKHKALRFAFISSNEIYGENRGDVEFFNEEYCGYINSNTMRAGYPESKRCSEALCQAYKIQKNLDVVIPRPTRSYGPTMLMNDTKAISQFIRKGIVGEDIILKSKGTQYYSYTYVADAVSGILYVLLKGINGEAYNIADIKSDIMLKDLAAIIAEIAGTKVRFEYPDALEASGYSTATKARIDGSRLMSLGWSAKYDIQSGIKRTISILKDVISNNIKV